MCTKVDGLSSGQIKLCQLYQDHMSSVSRGAQLGIRECQWQFQNRRWNCSVVEKDASVFGPVLEIRKYTCFQIAGNFIITFRNFSKMTHSSDI